MPDQPRPTIDEMREELAYLNLKVNVMSLRNKADELEHQAKIRAAASQKEGDFVILGKVVGMSTARMVRDVLNASCLD